jgi:hypothetical protein
MPGNKREQKRTRKANFNSLNYCTTKCAQMSYAIFMPSEWFFVFPSAFSQLCNRKDAKVSTHSTAIYYNVILAGVFRRCGSVFLRRDQSAVTARDSGQFMQEPQHNNVT